MKITTVSYGRTYPLGNYASERIDLEADVEILDDTQEVVNRLKFMCDEIHKKNNPHLYQEQTPIVSNQQIFTATAPIEIKQQEEKISPEQALKEQIDSANDLKGLEWLKPILKKFPQLETYYNEKHSQLTNNQ